MKYSFSASLTGDLSSSNITMVELAATSVSSSASTAVSLFSVFSISLGGGSPPSDTKFSSLCVSSPAWIAWRCAAARSTSWRRQVSPFWACCCCYCCCCCWLWSCTPSPPPQPSGPRQREVGWLRWNSILYKKLPPFVSIWSLALLLGPFIQQNIRNEAKASASFVEAKSITFFFTTNVIIHSFLKILSESWIDVTLCVNNVSMWDQSTNLSLKGNHETVWMRQLKSLCP